MSTRAAQIELLLGPLTDPTTGALCSGYTAYFYAAGTSTAKNVWTEKEKTNPFTSYALDSGGKILLYGDGIYKIVVKNADGTAVLTLDNVKIQANNYSVANKSGTYTATADDDCLICDGTWTLSLDPVANFSHPLEIINNGAGTITINPDGAETIGGSATLALGAGERARIIPDTASNAWYWVDFVGDVAAHAASTGTAVHGLGTMSTKAIAALDASIIPAADDSINLGSCNDSNVGYRFSNIFSVDIYACTRFIAWNGSAFVEQGRDVTAAIHRKIVNIGDWNMDSTASVYPLHGLTLTKIRSISAIIRNDADTTYYPLTIGGLGLDPAGYITYVDATQVALTRTESGSFDNSSFDSTGYNRGWIIIEYVD